MLSLLLRPRRARFEVGRRARFEVARERALWLRAVEFVRGEEIEALAGAKAL